MEKPFRRSSESDRLSADGKRDAFAHLAPMVYEQIRRLERRYMQLERPGLVYQPTTLVKEALAKLSADPSMNDHWIAGAHCNDPHLFFSHCARQMRHILVDHAKARGQKKRQSPSPEANADLDVLQTAEDNLDVLVLDQLLQRLEQLEPAAALTCELHYFGGHNHNELATITKVSESTVQRHLRLARAWLLAQVQRTGS